MEIRELKAFVILAEELNFRKAAERLGMTQPPLTRLIKQLEHDLEAKLFKRTTRSVELTPAGLHLLQRGKSLIAEFTKTEMEIKKLHQLKVGRLRIALSGPALHSTVPRLISHFKSEFPKVSVELVDNPKDLKACLADGRVDISFGVNKITDVDFCMRSIETYELGLLIPRDNVLSRKKSIKLCDLEGQTLIFHNRHEHLGFQAEFYEFLKSKGITPRVYYKKSREVCGHLVLLGKGLLITSKKFVDARTEAVYVPFAEYDPKVDILAMWGAGNSSISLKAFLNFLDRPEPSPSPASEAHL